jgi:Ca-activated chloride channel family protein
LLRSLALACLAVALARPQTVGGQVRIAGQGVAIVVALDRSPSMETEDFPGRGGRLVPRLEAAKATFAAFVEGRPDDLIGLVAFARHPDLVCPPTLDHGFLVDAARALRPARPEESGTNIGDAIAWSLDALIRTPPDQKVLVLLTDGRNQAEGIVPPPLPPREGAEIARGLGVTLHAIGVGQSGILRAAEGVTGLGRPIGESEGPDLELLGDLARIGGGRLFVAANAADLDAIFRALDALERSPVQGTIRTRYREWYPPWVAAAAVLLVFDRLLAAGRLRRLP